MKNEIYQGDCLEILRKFPENLVDLIVTDPPYYKVVDHWWDNQWSTKEEFTKWLGEVADEWQRVLKPGGSLYCFMGSASLANVDLMLQQRFDVLNRICLTENSVGRWRLLRKEGMRQYFPRAEYILFCSQNRKYLDAIAQFPDYFRRELDRSGLSQAQISQSLGGKGIANRFFSRSQWGLPSLKQYLRMQTLFAEQGKQPAPPKEPHPFEAIAPEPRDYLAASYQVISKAYDRLRRPMVLTKEVPYTDIWNFAPVQYYPGKHPCEKPIDMLRHIIFASSFRGDVILDSFCGSGNTLVAAKECQRQYVGIEINPNWVAKSRSRLSGSARSLTRDRWLASLKTGNDPVVEQLSLL